MEIFKVPPKRDVQLKIMIAPEEKAQIEAAAARHGITVSDLVRSAINDYVAKIDKRKSR